VQITLYIALLIMLVGAARVISTSSAVHAVLYMIVSTLALAVAVFIAGAPLAAALLVIVNAGGILVLFLFLVMILNLGRDRIQEKEWLRASNWFGPAILAAMLLVEFIYLLASAPAPDSSNVIGPMPVGIVLYTKYLLAVEIASMLLLSALAGAYHLCRAEKAEAKT
jgi:NADH-quinone oxidoreductase subunit J